MTQLNEWPRITSVTAPFCLIGDLNPATVPSTKSILWSDLIKSAPGGETLNVKQYGAEGDGSTGDAAAIRSAIAALPASGGTLYFPRGSYKLDSVVDIDVPLTLVCEPGTTIFRSAISYMFRIKSSNIRFSGFRFRKSAGEGGGVLARDVAIGDAKHNTGITFESCEFDGTWLYFEKLGATTDAGSTLESGSDVAGRIRVVNCYFHDIVNENAVKLTGITDADIVGCTFENVADVPGNTGRGVKCTAGATGYRVVHNYFKNIHRSFVDLFDSRRGLFAFNFCDTNTSGTAVLVKVGNTPSGDPVELIQIIGNHVRNVAPSYAAISAECDYVVIANNIVETAGTGIRSWLKMGDPGDKTIRNIVMGNIVRGCEYGMKSNSNYTLITGNQVSVSDKEGMQLYGDNLIVTDNIVVDSGANNGQKCIVIMSGTSCVVRDNITDDGSPMYAGPQDMLVGAANGFYLGRSDMNGSWRMALDGDDIVFQRREAGTYVTKGTFTAS